MSRLDPATASRFASTALGHVAREYPNKLDHVLVGPADARTPRDLHPAFYGSFDWHSCVHSWRTLLRLRRTMPEVQEAAAIDQCAAATFTANKLAAERAYAARASAYGFERPYGWAWFNALHLEASRHDAPWAERMEDLASIFASRFAAYLGLLSYPITTGTHYNTAFAMLLMHRWGQRFDPALTEVIKRRAHVWFAALPRYEGWEPGGDEFLSPVLTVAALMGQVLGPDMFRQWLVRVLPPGGWLEARCHPVAPADRSDGKTAHLDGLNFSRAWCLAAIAGRLPVTEVQRFKEPIDAHIRASLPAVDGDYMGSHWLASFALLAMEAEATGDLAI